MADVYNAYVFLERSLGITRADSGVGVAKVAEKTYRAKFISESAFKEHSEELSNWEFFVDPQIIPRDVSPDYVPNADIVDAYKLYKSEARIDVKDDQLERIASEFATQHTRGNNQEVVAYLTARPGQLAASELPNRIWSNRYRKPEAIRDGDDEANNTSICPSCTLL